jgi:hypothetical protein
VPSANRNPHFPFCTMGMEYTAAFSTSVLIKAVLQEYLRKSRTCGLDSDLLRMLDMSFFMRLANTTVYLLQIPASSLLYPTCAISLDQLHSALCTICMSVYSSRNAPTLNTGLSRLIFDHLCQNSSDLDLIVFGNGQTDSVKTPSCFLGESGAG